MQLPEITVSNYFSAVAHCKYTSYYPEYKRFKSSCATVSSGRLVAHAAVTPGALVHYTRSLSDSSSHESDRKASTAKSVHDISVFCRAGVVFTQKMSSGKILLEEKQDVFQLLSKSARHLERAGMVEQTASRKNLPVNLRAEILLM